MDTIKRRYSDAELEEFRAIILGRLETAKADYAETMKVLTNQETKEELVHMAMRQQKFIQGLQAALLRIDNKTYGIDRITGELIPKERLRAVPHATLSVQSKQNYKDH